MAGSLFFRCVEGPRLRSRENVSAGPDNGEGLVVGGENPVGAYVVEVREQTEELPQQIFFASQRGRVGEPRRVSPNVGGRPKSSVLAVGGAEEGDLELGGLVGVGDVGIANGNLFRVVVGSGGEDERSGQARKGTSHEISRHSRGTDWARAATGICGFSLTLTSESTDWRPVLLT